MPKGNVFITVNKSSQKIIITDFDVALIYYFKGCRPLLLEIFFCVKDQKSSRDFHTPFFKFLRRTDFFFFIKEEEISLLRSTSNFRNNKFFQCVIYKSQAPFFFGRASNLDVITVGIILRILEGNRKSVEKQETFLF